ncbi:hypothetical protein CsSME_00021687 [Camellia sinensis var. sinensis]
MVLQLESLIPNHQKWVLMLLNLSGRDKWPLRDLKHKVKWSLTALTG